MWFYMPEVDDVLARHGLTADGAALNEFVKGRGLVKDSGAWTDPGDPRPPHRLQLKDASGRTVGDGYGSSPEEAIRAAVADHLEPDCGQGVQTESHNS